MSQETTPLSEYTHFGSPHGVDQVPQCLDRIELRTSRLTAQRYTHQTTVSPNVCIYPQIIPKHQRN
jgi:hypothetical protein